MVWNTGSGTRCVIRGWGKGEGGKDGPGPLEVAWFKTAGTRLSGISWNKNAHLVEVEFGDLTAWEEALGAYGS